MTVGRKFAYFHNLDILHCISHWQALDGLLFKAMAILTSHLYKRKLKLNETKTVSAAFHFYNKEARPELNIFINKQALPLCAEPTYLGLKLDRTFTFCQHLEPHRKKLESLVGLLKQLVGSSWDVDVTVFSTAIFPWVYSTAKYCTPVWCRGAHTRLIDKPFNDALRIMIGLRSTQTNNLFTLLGI